MQFKFSQYQYQTDAADAVCDVFDGQPLQDGVSYIRDTGIRKPASQVLNPAQDTFDIPELRPVQEMLGHFDADDDTGYRNADLLLDGERLLANIKNVQRRQNLTESPKLYTDPAGAVELDVEMETGTGKTFVYTKTMFELNRRYGWSKFIVVVPSIAIREGVRQDRNLLSNADFLDVNLLTVIASESYERFAESLQKDIETDLRERPIVINDAFFAKTCVPADKLGPEYAGLGDVSFSKDEARDIVYALTVDRLIDRDGKLTDKYKEERFGKDAVELLPEPLRKKVPAIRLVLDSVVEGTTKVLIGNALKRKVHGNPLNANWQKKEFQELWRRINHKYAYTVSFDDDELVKNAVKAIDERLVVSKLSYTVTRGIQKENTSRNELADRTHFHRNDSHTDDLDVDASNGVKYDLLGEIAQAATITRRCAARILKSIRPDRFLMFRDNPEQFIARVGRLIVQEKANMVVDHICYDRIEGGYDSSIFTKGGNNRDEAEGYQASKCVQDWVFPDGRIESDFAKDLDNAAEVAVYAKLPRGFQIPTPVGNYAPDWAVAFRDDSGLKHLFFVAETKGTMDSFELRGIEDSKIACAKRLFNELDLADGARYEQATTYQTLLDEVKALQ